jgi:hypothetical protein
VAGEAYRSSGTSLRLVGQAADLEKFESERFDLGLHAVQGGLVRDGAAQQRVLALNTKASSQNAARPREAGGAALVMARSGRGLVIVVFMGASLTPGGVSRRHTAG